MQHPKIKSFKQACLISKELQKKGKKVVFCHGFFDILHFGHVTLLLKAKKLGDVLVIGMDHDDNARLLKGPNRPINDHWSRMFILANLEPVDFVFLIPDYKEKSEKAIFNFFVKLYLELKPAVVATSLKAGEYGHLKKKQAKEAGIKFKDIDHGIYGRKTSKIIRLLEKQNENRFSP